MVLGFTPLRGTLGNMFRYLIIFLCCAVQFGKCLPEKVCDLPMDKGKCESPLRKRWYFDAKSKACKTFLFSCGGNGNNFMTRDECIGTCTDVCTLPLGLGSGWSSLTRYYFNKKLNKCEKFKFAGKGGYKNNFPSLDKCQRTCMGVCRLPPEVGLCRAMLRRYYYNHKLHRCVIFIYGGCSGNRNNFKNIKDCKNACQDFV